MAMPESEKARRAWVDGVYWTLMVLEDSELPAGGPKLDYSAESLKAVEALLLDRVDTPTALLAPGNQALIRGVTAYLGETLMRLAGGRWEWDGEEALVGADPATGLEPVSPEDVVLEAVRVRDGRRLAAVHSAWADAVADTSRTDPRWKPVKEPTGADSPDPGSTALTRWLARQEAGFPHWARTYAPDDLWDWSRDSLPRLEEVARRIAASAGELNAPGNREFRDGAAWYLGEVLRRGAGGRWNFNDRRRSANNHPYLEHLGPNDHKSWPVVALGLCLEDPGYLLDHYDTVV
ncbi:hypothetical protein Afil01_29190 [Actinorhabdospora filicis]|uniref:Uncharacterized protein n=1 Tax=Actinorhabdospora filicis TaxID=1785913 RepID=A0A9W6W3G0_9ACTN|nr:hypothetical protein [Actinorhabdospora filicis]GLZ78112.1 hypothetical protein Afil01_29190 [Actinorhabdospora filicis]